MTKKMSTEALLQNEYYQNAVLHGNHLLHKIYSVDQWKHPSQCFCLITNLALTR